MPERLAVGDEQPTGRVLTEVVTRLQRTLRTSIRTDYPWETLPMAQIELLMALQEHQPARVGQLAALLRLAPNTVSGLVQQLVEAGFADRESHTHDRRVAVVTLTESGLRQLDDWTAAHHHRIGDALGSLPTHEQAAIRAALPALAHLVDSLAGAPPFTGQANPEDSERGSGQRGVRRVPDVKRSSRG